MQEDLADMLPAIEEANSISAELDKKKKFEMVMTQVQGNTKDKKKGKVRDTLPPSDKSSNINIYLICMHKLGYIKITSAIWLHIALQFIEFIDIFLICSQLWTLWGSFT